MCKLYTLFRKEVDFFTSVPKSPIYKNHYMSINDAGIKRIVRANTNKYKKFYRQAASANLLYAATNNMVQSFVTLNV